MDIGRFWLLGLLAVGLIQCKSALPPESDLWLTYPGCSGPGATKHIVLVSGDEEYRSEEALPMLARVLSVWHGFKTTVLFAIDPDKGFIDPNNQTNIPGLEFLDNADLMILFTRFRELPDPQMAHIVKFVNSGKPIIGLRTATHAFNYQSNQASPYAKYSFRSKEWPGGFGRQVLGETWINHHGRHKVESFRGIVNRENREPPILRGIGEIWGPTDVYGITTLPDDAQVLVWGQVLQGMSPDDPPLEGPKNEPMVPLAWIRQYLGESGRRSRVFCTTAGASVDFENEDLRRLLVNACYWGLEMENRIPPRSQVDLVGDYSPSFYGFHSGEDFWRQKNLRPGDWRLQKQYLKR